MHSSKTMLPSIEAAVLSLQNISKVFPGRNSLVDKVLRRTSKEFVAIANIDLEVSPNTFVSIIGPSGCGKSTLLNIIAGLSQPTTGIVTINGQPVSAPGA